MTEQKKTTKIKKRKVSIADLQTKPKRLILVHPDETIDLDGAWIDIVPPHSSVDYIMTAMFISERRADEMELHQQIELTAKMVVSVIDTWDEDSFGMEFNTNDAISFFSKPDNFWIRNLIQAAIADDSDFFN